MTWDGATSTYYYQMLRSKVYFYVARYHAASIYMYLCTVSKSIYLSRDTQVYLDIYIYLNHHMHVSILDQSIDLFLGGWENPRISQT